jgi:hypothetical protein
MRYALMNSRWVAGRLAGWPAHALSWPDVPLGWPDPDPLSWPDDSLLQWRDAPLGWPDPAEWQWPDPDPLSWPDDRWPAGHILVHPGVVIGCITTPDSACITGGPSAPSVR